MKRADCAAAWRDKAIRANGIDRRRRRREFVTNGGNQSWRRFWVESVAAPSDNYFLFSFSLGSISRQMVSERPSR